MTTAPFVPGRRRWLTVWWPWLTATGTGITASIVLLALGHTGAARTVMVVLGTVLAASSSVPAVRETLRERAILQPVTWGIWAVLTATAATASTAAGDYPAAVFAAVGTATCTTVAVVARHGRWRPTRLDAMCALLAIAGIGAWQGLHQGAAAITAACVGDLLGLIPTVRQVWAHPDQVPAPVFALIAAGGLCTVAASWGTWTATAITYPLYVAVSTGAVALLTRRTILLDNDDPGDTPAPPGHGHTPAQRTPATLPRNDSTSTTEGASHGRS